MDCFRAAALGFVIPLLVSGHAAASDWEIRTLGRIDGLVDLHKSSAADVIVAETRMGSLGIGFGLDGTLRQVSVSQPTEPPADSIPHSRCAEGTADIRLACLTGPTLRYDHGVLGDAVEAEALTVRRGDGGWSRFRLDDDAVFEDLTPRLADIDRDGLSEVIVVKSAPGEGAALALLALDGADLHLVAKSDAIGLSNRWLNPVGAGDFDGDGRIEIAVVRTPHIGGILMIYRREDRRLVLEGSLRGYSNHQIGATALGLSAVLDLDGDGIDDILLPRQNRARIAAISFAGGALREIGEADLVSPVATSMIQADVDNNGRPDVVFGLSDGDLVALIR